jgi:CheY-like chemotaxis protein
MRVVVVDPSRTVSRTLSRLLESGGHVVSAFVDGPEALDCINSASDSEPPSSLHPSHPLICR